MRGAFQKVSGRLWSRRWFWVRQAIGVAGVVASMVLIGMDLPHLEPLPQLLRGDAKGLLAAGALLVIVLVAPLVYETGVGPFRGPLLVLAATASAVAMAKLPTALGVVWELRAVLAVVLGTLVGKLLLLHRFAGFHGAKVRRVPEELDRLLPFQRQDLERLREAILHGRLDEARVVQLAGRWGEGKSFLLERLGLYLAHAPEAGHSDDPCAVVVVNVWEQQSEPDLHLAIVEEILGHRCHWYPYAWLRYPLSLVLAQTVKELRLKVSAGSSSKTEIELPLRAPRPTGKRALARLVARAQRQGWRTVVVLDEADRAAPPMAQAAVTLALRSLDIPGVVVVLAYVDELLRYKAFNPLIDSLPDLGSTMRAVIFAEGPDRGRADQPGGADGSLRRRDAWEHADEMQLPSQTPSPPASGEQRRATDRDGQRLSEALRLEYAGASPETRRVLQRRFAEKYLGSRPIEMRRPDDRDVARMVVTFDTLSYLVRDLVGAGNEAAVVAAVELALTTWRNRRMKTHEVAPLRSLKGELFRRLSSLDLDQHEMKQVSPQFVAAVVLAAYDAAALQYAKRGDGR